MIKHGPRMLENAIKIERDWATRITPRVDCLEYASAMGYKSNHIMEVGHFSLFLLLLLLLLFSLLLLLLLLL